MDEIGSASCTGVVSSQSAMDNAGLSARQAADRLGQLTISMTQDFYLGRKIASTGARDVLEVFGNSPEP